MLHSPPRLSVSTLILLWSIAATTVAVGCKGPAKDAGATSETTTLDDYSTPLPPGTPALELVTDRALIHQLGEAAYKANDAMLIEALKGSRKWFRKPSAKTHFPMDGISFERAQATVDSLLELLRRNPTHDEFVSAIKNGYDFYRSVGWNGDGTVLFTGYCSLEFDASRERTAEFKYPLYRRPDDLVTDEKTGKPLGRRLEDGRVVPYPTREEIEESNMLGGNELVYLANPLDAYVVHVNGSARLRLRDGSRMYVGYAGKTDREYRSLGEAMVKRGLLTPGGLSLKSIRDYFRDDTTGLNDLLYENESFVFFTEYSEENWPAGSLNIRVTEKRTLATDKSIFPRGGPVLVDTMIPTYSGRLEPFTQIMVDQDTGGAIKAPGRADIYIGQGKAAQILAGRQKQEGRMYYLFLKE